MNEDEIKKTFAPKDLTVQFAKEDDDAYLKLKQLVTEAKDGSFRKERDEMEIKKNDLIKLSNNKS